MGPVPPPTDDTDDTDELVCGVCGSVVRANAVPAARLSWVHGVEDGRPSWICDRCARTHLRAIEGKLDSAWW